MLMYHLGPQLGVWIMQVSTFSSVLINRFHCECIISSDLCIGNPSPVFPVCVCVICTYKLLL